MYAYEALARWEAGMLLARRKDGKYIWSGTHCQKERAIQNEITFLCNDGRENAQHEKHFWDERLGMI